MIHDDFYEQVYRKQDRTYKPDTPNGWIQWKGTDVCIDLHCTCGYDGHVDSEFFYYYECPDCKGKYALSPNIALIPLTDEQTDFVKQGMTGFITCDLEQE